MHYLIIYRKWV